MRATKIVFVALLLVLLALAGAVAYLPIYLEDHRDLIEAGVTLALGRPVEIESGLTVKADLVAAKRIQAKDVRGHVLLENGRLRLEGFSTSLPGLPLTERATLDATAKPPTIDLALAAAGALRPFCAFTWMPRHGSWQRSPRALST